MKTLHEIEAEIVQRTDGWWQRVVSAIPELAPMEETPQSPEHHAEGNVAVHTRLAIEACPEGSDRDLFWVALLHDVGKPQTTREQPDGRITAYGHDKLGAELARGILQRLGMSAERSNRIEWAIRHHMFHHSWQLQSGDSLTNRQKSYLLHPDFPLLLDFLQIDALASSGKADKMQSYLFYKELFRQIAGEQDTII